jgi:hypothetical protein
MNTASRLIAVGLLLSSTSVGHLHAQHMTAAENPIFNGERKFTAGLALGTNISQVDGDNLSGFSKVGLNAGAVLNINFTEKVGLGFEILYSQKGSSSVGTGYSTIAGSYYGKYKMKLNYAELPLILYYNLQPKFQFGIGASYNVLISSKETYDDGMNPIYTISSDDFPFNKSSVDALISGSVVVYQGLVLQARYQYSITPIRDFDHAYPLFAGGDQKNNFFALRMIYLF